MCGIAGFLACATVPGGLPEQLRQAAAALSHRGPDDEGFWIDESGRVGFGHRRLSIIDLSAHGHQPMTSACGQWTMVFNGEVYNFRELRAELEALGHRFSGTGDSEVILAGFSQWGPDAAVRRFIGMFAIALWHRPTRSLHLIRDRLGVKPLYYHWNRGELYFGSELKAVRAFRNWRPEVDPVALEDYLREGYVDHPMSIYRDVHKVAPGHRVCVDADGQLTTVRYWQPLENRRDMAGRSEDDLADELEALLTSAFKYRMIADVPVGVFLSGGVDSSLLAALLAKHAGTSEVNTFTIGFNEQGYDESGHAEAIARHLGTHQTTRHLTIDEAMRLLPQWGDLYDEPFADASGLPTLLVSRMAAEKVKVVLSADGGDELFAGYDTYVSVINRLRKLESIPHAVRASASGLLNGAGVQSLDDWLATRPGGLAHAVRRRLSTPLADIARRIAPQPQGRHFDEAKFVFRDDELARLLGRRTRKTRAACDDYPGEIGDRMGLWDLEHYMAEDILTKVDRATMAASIEGREPLIDHRIVEFAFSLPYHLKQGSLGTKHLLRKVLYRHVPRALIERPKQGFSVPMKHWLTGGMKHLPEEALERSRLVAHSLVDADEARRYLSRLQAGDAAAAHKVWVLSALEMWHARWMQA